MILNTQVMVDTGMSPLREGSLDLVKVGQGSWRSLNEEKTFKMFMHIT